MKKNGNASFNRYEKKVKLKKESILFCKFTGVNSKK